MKNRFHLALTAVGAVSFLTASAQPRVLSGQFTFGDSLSDNGNSYAASGRTTPPPPYFQGRFSNGLMFTERLGQLIEPHATAGSARTNLNFAYGGATALAGSTVPSVAQQIELYRTQGIPATRTDLFTVLIGANDILAATRVPATAGDPVALDAAAVAAAGGAANAVQTLAGLGAKNIVVAGLPNLGTTPRAIIGGAAATAAAQRASFAFNRELRARLEALAAAAPDLNLVYVDLEQIGDRIIRDSRALGLANTTAAYLAPAELGGGEGDPNRYMFWDEIHPTATTHALIGAIIVEQLNPQIPLAFAGTVGTAALALEETGYSTVAARGRAITLSERATRKVEVYSTFDYANGQRADGGGHTEFDFAARTATAGGDVLLRDGVFVGGAVQAGQLDAEARMSLGSFSIQDAGARVYGVWRGGPVALTLDCGYGIVRVRDIERTTAFGGLQTMGRTDGDRWGAGLRAQWTAGIAGVPVRPWLGLRTARVRLDGYTESDVPALAMAYAEQTAQLSSATVGLETGWSRTLASRALRIDLRGAWHGEIDARTRNVTGKLADNFTLPATVAIEDGAGTGVELGVGAMLALSQRLQVALGYSAELRESDGVQHRASLALQTGF